MNKKLAEAREHQNTRKVLTGFLTDFLWSSVQRINPLLMPPHRNLKSPKAICRWHKTGKHVCVWKRIITPYRKSCTDLITQSVRNEIGFNNERDMRGVHQLERWVEKLGSIGWSKRSYEPSLWTAWGKATPRIYYTWQNKLVGWPHILGAVG